LRDGVHFRKPGDDSAPRRKRPWWLLDLLVPVVVALVITIVLVVQLSGHQDSRRSSARPSAAEFSPGTGATPKPAPAAASASTTGSTASPAGGAAVTAPPSNPSTTATTAPAGPPPAAPPAVDPALLPDGSALPVLIVFDGSTINISGSVPSNAAGQRLAVLAESYSKTPNAQVVSNLIVDPRVPSSTGVRVIEMNAARFDTGSSQIAPAYAPELARVVALLKAMPNLTALVIGHADQRGDAALNLSLSEARATAVVEYLSGQGINADRLSAQGVGDQSPLTRQSDAAGLALNRRTEFVFYGLLAGA
jgi:outer membrane protein OmpA-like peptidoglycan-associated protein